MHRGAVAYDRSLKWTKNKAMRNTFLTLMENTVLTLMIGNKAWVLVRNKALLGKTAFAVMGRTALMLMGNKALITLHLTQTRSGAQSLSYLVGPDSFLPSFLSQQTGGMVLPFPLYLSSLTH